MKKLLNKLNACQMAINWAGDKTWEEAYNTCRRGDWLLWLFARTNPDNFTELTLTKAYCANTVRHLMKDERSINAVDIAIAFGNGEASIDDLNAAYSAAAAAAADSAAAAAAADADAAADAYSANYAAAAAAAANYAAAAAAANAAAVAASKLKNQKLTSDICRKYLPIKIWNI